MGGPWTYEGEHSFDMSDADKAFYEPLVARLGAGLVGRGMYDAAGAWGGTNPFPGTLEVLTHRLEDQPEPAAGFHFVDGFDHALDAAREDAGDKDVSIGGGADIIRQGLRAAWSTSCVVSTAPVILGGGKRLFDGFEEDVDLRIRGVHQSEWAVHTTYEVLLEMAIATWKDLCIDAVDAHLLGRFWGAALGLDGRGPWTTATPCSTGRRRSTRSGSTPSPSRSPSSSASTSTSTPGPSTTCSPWRHAPRTSTPSAGRSCATRRVASCACSSVRRSRDYRLYELGVDSVEPRPIAYWWADVLGATYVREGGRRAGTRSSRSPAPRSRASCSTRCPNPRRSRTGSTGTSRPTTSPLLTDAGATRPAARCAHWTVMADPEGNEFCAFLPRED